MNRPPAIISAEDLAPFLRTAGVIVADLSQDAAYQAQHIPGAVHIDASRLASSHPPVMGLLPPQDVFAQLLSGAGITPDSYVVAYDSETGLKASRFLWTLDVIGHPRASLLDGGLAAWAGAGLPLEDKVNTAQSSEYPVTYGDEHCVDKRYILDHLEDPNVVVLDTRSPGEFRGGDRRALRAGHIPGAVNIEWTQALAGGGDLRLRPAEELEALFASAGVTPDKEVIVHCQTHQRSAHTYMVLRSLGYERVKGYPGSWSDWGNDDETPVET